MSSKRQLEIYGKSLRLIRQYKNQTQTEMAKSLEISSSHYSEIECGKRDPSITLLQRFCAQVPMNLSEFFEWTNEVSGILFDTKKSNPLRLIRSFNDIIKDRL